MKALQWINLFGVLALAALCVAQWQRDRRFNLEINMLVKDRQAQELKTAEQEGAARAVSEDLARFKDLFQQARAEFSASSSNCSKLEREHFQLQNEREQLKTSVTNWARAVTQRDARLREAKEQLRDFSERLNDSVRKFNDLATNYNASIRRFNDLATNYNDVVAQLNELRAGKGK